MRRAGLILLGLLLAVAPVASSSRSLLLGKSYPIEVAHSFHFALLHWLDSLAGLQGPGMTAGKTVTAHREEYSQLFGAPTEDDGEQLRIFADIRIDFAKQAAPADRQGLTLAFLEADDLASAIERSVPLIGRERSDRLRAALEYFAPSFTEIWRDAAVPRRFVSRARADRQRRAVGRFLVRMAGFYGVDAVHKPPPRLVLVPVRMGHGTHAQAIGRHLLVEIRDSDGLSEEIQPIVHENAHFLFLRIDEERRRALREFAASQGERGLKAWQLLLEALPTALGQGVAGERFNGDWWSPDGRWYHRQDVDQYAKRIHPLVRERLESGGRFDVGFLEQAIRLTPRSP